jgi:hypothetical protein
MAKFFQRAAVRTIACGARRAGRYGPAFLRCPKVFIPLRDQIAFRRLNARRP